MPAILAADAQVRWLAGETPATERLKLLRPAPEDELEIRQVRRTVNNPRNEGAGLIEAVSERTD